MNITNLFYCLSPEEKKELKRLLDIQEAYDRKEQGLMTIAEFIKDKEASIRLANCLKQNYDLSMFVSHIDEKDFLRQKNVGRRSHKEFIELRGY